MSVPVSGGPVPQVVSVEDGIDHLWKVIARFDTYIGGTNTKAAMLIAFNTFVPGSVALKWQDIQAAFGPEYRPAFILASAFLLVALAASVVSLVFTFWAISPFLKSPERPEKYHSDVFFGDVAKHAQAEEYLERVEQWDDMKVRRDLAFQAHVLAGGLADKFRRLKVAIGLVMFVQLPLFGAMILSYLCVVVWGVLHKAAG